MTEEEESQLLEAECEPSADQSQEVWGTWAALAVPWSSITDVRGGVDDGLLDHHRQTMPPEGKGGRAAAVVDSVIPIIPSSSSKQPVHGERQHQCY